MKSCSKKLVERWWLHDELGHGWKSEIKLKHKRKLFRKVVHILTIFVWFVSYTEVDQKFIGFFTVKGTHNRSIKNRKSSFSNHFYALFTSQFYLHFLRLQFFQLSSQHFIKFCVTFFFTLTPSLPPLSPTFAPLFAGPFTFSCSVRKWQGEGGT